MEWVDYSNERLCEIVTHCSESKEDVIVTQRTTIHIIVPKLKINSRHWVSNSWPYGVLEDKTEKEKRQTGPV